MTVHIPFAERPRASIVVVTWNAVEWSRRAIEAIATHTELPYELIVVDNGSVDGTRDYLHDQVSGATVIVNFSNLGFGVASNLGAARARAPVVVFVNSDLVVGPGWLAPLCLRLENDPGACVVGPKIVDLNGRLDHAGALLAHDGWAMHYGSGDDPARPEYSFARRVDYVSGACFAVRARVFHESGGFDPWFQTAYFEDADLCLRLAAQGWEIWYEPASVVTHAGGASGTEEERLRLLAINHPRFQQRWREVLAMRPDVPLTARSERIIGARDAVAAGTILLIGDETGAARDLAQLLLNIPGLLITLAGEHAAGVENAVVLSPEWLRDRRFHYDLIAGSDPRLESFIDETQPQAIRVTLERLREAFDATLMAAGIDSQRPRSRARIR